MLVISGITLWKSEQVGLHLCFLHFFWIGLIIFVLILSCFSQQCLFLINVFVRRLSPNSWNGLSLYINHVIFSDMLWRTSVCNLQRDPVQILPLVCVCFLEADCVSWHQGDWECVFLCHHPLKGEVIKTQWVQQAVLPSYTLRLSTLGWIGGPSITKGEKRTFYWRLRMWGDAPSLIDTWCEIVQFRE